MIVEAEAGLSCGELLSCVETESRKEFDHMCEL
jgi:hypothetical protein